MTAQTRNQITTLIAQTVKDNTTADIDAADVRAVLQNIVDSAHIKSTDSYPSAAAGNPQRLLIPQLEFPSKSWISSFPVDANGIPNNDPNAFSLAGQDDWSLEFMHLYIEAAKDQSRAICLVGAYRCAGPFYMPMGAATLFGMSRNGAHVIYDGPDGGDFLLEGDVVAPEIAMPVTNVSVAGGKTTLTIGVPSASLKAKFRRASAAQGGGAWTDFLAITDPWGQWLGEFANGNLRDNGANFARLPRFSFDGPNRKITFTGTVAWAPTWFTIPALNASTQAYSGTDSHPRHRFEEYSKISFWGRDKGTQRHQYTRGVKGRGDPATRYHRLKFIGMKSVYFDADSDSLMEDLAWASSPGDGPTLTSVDSQWGEIQITSSVKLGFIFDSNFGQSKIERLKCYYASTLANTLDEAGAVTFKTNLAGLHVPGPFIIEDNAGPCARLENNVRNVILDFCEFNNPGCVGQGAPGLSGRPFYDADIFFAKNNVSVLGLKAHGIVRGNYGNRGGSHVSRLLYISAADTNAWGVTGGRYLFRDIDIDLDMVVYTQSELHLEEWPGEDTPLWNSGKANYALGDIVRLTSSAAATRYEPRVANPTAGLSPATNTDQWKVSINGGRQAWLRAFECAGEVISNTRPKEFCNVKIVMNGKRDPSYHRRPLPGWPSFAIDHQHDYLPVNMAGAAAQSVGDVFKGEHGKRQVFTATETGKTAGQALSQSFKLEPGSRSRSVPWKAGAAATIARAGKEMEIEHRDGKVWWVEHKQHEAIPTSLTAITADLGDWGHTLEIAEDTTITLPAAADVPAGWYFDVLLMGSGKTVTYSGTVTNGSTLTTQYQKRRVEKVGSALLMRTV